MSVSVICSGSSIRIVRVHAEKGWKVVYLNYSLLVRTKLLQADSAAMLLSTFTFCAGNDLNEDFP